MKLNIKRTILIGFAFMSICSFWQLYEVNIPLILKNTFNLDDITTGAIMAADNVLAVFMLPLFGALSDKTRTKIGKRMPYILIGSVLAAGFTIMLPIFDILVSSVAFFITLGLTLIALAVYRSPAVSLMPDLTPKRHRSTANAIINLMGTLGAIFAILAIKMLVGPGEKPNYLPVFAAIAVFMLVSVAVLFVSVKEQKLLDEQANSDEDYGVEKEPEINKGVKMEKAAFKSLIFLLAAVFFWFVSYNAISSAFSRYAVEVWGLSSDQFTDPLLVGTVTGVLSYLPIAWISNKLGRKFTIMSGIIIMTVVFAISTTFATYTPIMNLFFAFIGFAWAAINVNSYPMVVEMSGNSDVGKYTGFYYTASMSAQIATPIISGYLLQTVSYKTLFPYATVFMLLAFIAMLFVKHGDVKNSKKIEK